MMLTIGITVIFGSNITWEQVRRGLWLVSNVPLSDPVTFTDSLHGKGLPTFRIGHFSIRISKKQSYTQDNKTISTTTI